MKISHVNLVIQIVRNALVINLITVDYPSYFSEVAEILKTQWRTAGINLNVEILNKSEILKRIEMRDYDLLLFSQKLGYNPDAYGFWHLSQTKTGLNLSEYQSMQASVLLEEIRATHNVELRRKNLEKLQGIIKDDVPAVFLFSPEYVLPINSEVKNVQIEKWKRLSTRTNIETKYINIKTECGKIRLTLFRNP